MNVIRIQQSVGPDGVLSLQLPLGVHLAGTQVEIEVNTSPKPLAPEEWKAAVRALAGSWQGEFEKMEHLPLEERDPL